MSTNIKVCVRVRPENERERAMAVRPVVSVMDESVLVFDPVYDESVSYFHGRALKDPTSRKPRNANFAFDRVFGPSATNIEVYEQTTKSVLRSLIDGYNCSVFAYGATGAGKTFSMLGSPQTPGVIFLSMMDLYNIKESEREERKIEVSVSYLEVYNENIKDLLQPGNGNLPIRENGKHGIVVTGLTVREPKSAEELLQMLEKGNKNRTQHPTDANAESSRSHAIFQVFVRVSSNTASLSENVKISKLSLIDLAGSERATMTKNKGARLREGANINKSLLALGNCINALADTKRKGSKHIPYRNSKLTRILKDSLGDNCKTVMLAAVSPARQSYEDTYNTLSYADRAKKIKAVLKKNVFSMNAHVQNYGKVVEDLHGEIAKLKEKLRSQSQQLAEHSSLSSLPSAVCAFNIDKLQTDISMAYGERRQIRDDILHIESMQKQVSLGMLGKRQMLNRLNLVSGSHRAGVRTVGKVVRSLESANIKRSNLEKAKACELQRLDGNTVKLSELVEIGNSVENSHAQTILQLQMKAYNHEQEARECQKENQHLVKLINSMQEEQKSNERMVEMFIAFLNSSENLLGQYGLQNAGLDKMYTNIKDYITNKRIVKFNSGGETEGDDPDAFKSLIQLPILSADENSIQLTGKPILQTLDETIVLDATFTCPVESQTDESLPVESAAADTCLLTYTEPLSPGLSSMQTQSPIIGVESPPPLAAIKSRNSLLSTQDSSPYASLRRSPRITTASGSPPAISEVRSVTKGTGCVELEDADDPPDCPPAKLRILARPVADSLSPLLAAPRSKQSPHTNNFTFDSTPESTATKNVPTTSHTDTTPVTPSTGKSRHNLDYANSDQLNGSATGQIMPATPELMDISMTASAATSPYRVNNTTVTLHRHDSAMWGSSPLTRTFADVLKSPAMCNNSPTVKNSSISSFDDIVRSSPATPLTVVNRIDPSLHHSSTPSLTPLTSIPGYLKTTQSSTSKCHRTAHQENHII